MQDLHHIPAGDPSPRRAPSSSTRLRLIPRSILALSELSAPVSHLPASAPAILTHITSLQARECDDGGATHAADGAHHLYLRRHHDRTLRSDACAWRATLPVLPACVWAPGGFSRTCASFADVGHGAQAFASVISATIMPNNFINPPGKRNYCLMVFIDFRKQLPVRSYLRFHSHYIFFYSFLSLTVLLYCFH